MVEMLVIKLIFMRTNSIGVCCSMLDDAYAYGYYRHDIHRLALSR